jgi:hypothetical protein
MKKQCLAVLLLAALVSCKKDEAPTPAVIDTKDFLVSGSAVGAHDLFSLQTGARVANTDSASTKWDFGMRFEKFIFNSNASGPGNAGVQILNTTFDAVTTAPDAGYAYDTTATQLAVKGAQWYTYNPTTRSFSPIAGRTFVIRTATGNYAKMEVLSAEPADDAGNPVTPPTRPTKIKYRIRYAYQASGSKVF